MTKPLIIAEMSANHLGNFTRAYEIVAAAARAGADAVKLQCWTPGTMCVSDYVMSHGPWAGKRMRDLYSQCHTPLAWFEPLFGAILAHGMIPFASAFDVAAVEFLENIGTSIHKASSFELIDDRLLQRMNDTSAQTILLSTGAATYSDIHHALTVVDPARTTLLHCVSEYPSDASKANLATMVNMREAFYVNVGLSDHSRGIGVAVAAAALGATVIEKHLTLSRSDGGPDAEFSMEPHEFSAMVNAVHQAAASVGNVAYVKHPSDWRRGLWISADRKAGDLIDAACLTTARPQLGMPASTYFLALGQRFTRDVTAGEPLAVTDLEPVYAATS